MLFTLSTTKIDKSNKSSKDTVLSAILNLAPEKSANGKRNVCPDASSGCVASCLQYTGMLAMPAQTQAQVRKTNEWFDHPRTFVARLSADLDTLQRRAVKTGKKLAVRLNGFSDIPFERYAYALKAIFENHPGIQFYDYTKSKKRMDSFLAGQFPKNYYLTFSFSEVNRLDAREVLKDGGNVAVVFRHSSFPSSFLGHDVLDGDKHDLRFTDARPSVVALKAKGPSVTDKTGFVVDVCPDEDCNAVTAKRDDRLYGKTGLMKQASMMCTSCLFDDSRWDV